MFNELATGEYFATGPCPDPSQGEEVDTLGPVELSVLSRFFPATVGIDPMPEYPPGRQCNVEGLTELGSLPRPAADGGGHDDRRRPHERASP